MGTKKDKSPEERRGSVRYPYTCAVSFTTLGNSHNLPNGLSKQTEIIDISNQGMKINISGHCLREGSMIELRLPVIKLKVAMPAMPLLAEARWVKHKIRNDYQVGLKFIVL